MGIGTNWYQPVGVILKSRDRLSESQSQIHSGYLDSLSVCPQQRLRGGCSSTVGRMSEPSREKVQSMIACVTTSRPLTARPYLLVSMAPCQGNAA